MAVEKLIKDKIDVCLISETKIDESLSNQQFKTNGYEMFRNNRDLERSGGGIVFYVQKQSSEVFCRKSVLRNFAKFTGKHLPQSLFINKVAGLRQWLCIGIYRPPSQNENYFTDHLPKSLGRLTCQYDKTMLIEDLNLAFGNKSLENFMSTIN